MTANNNTNIEVDFPYQLQLNETSSVDLPKLKQNRHNTVNVVEKRQTFQSSQRQKFRLKLR